MTPTMSMRRLFNEPNLTDDGWQYETPTVATGTTLNGRRATQTVGAFGEVEWHVESHVTIGYMPDMDPQMRPPEGTWWLDRSAWIGWFITDPTTGYEGAMVHGPEVPEIRSVTTVPGRLRVPERLIDALTIGVTPDMFGGDADEDWLNDVIDTPEMSAMWALTERPTEDEIAERAPAAAERIAAAREALDRIGARREAYLEERRAIDRELEVVAPAAEAVGVSRAEIARRTSFDRAGLYRRFGWQGGDQ